MGMKIDMDIWIPALREEFKDAEFLADILLFFNTHLPCTCCKKIKRDIEFHKGNSPARRGRYPLCKDCTSRKRERLQVVDIPPTVEPPAEEGPLLPIDKMDPIEE